MAVNTINPRPIQPILDQLKSIGIPERSPLWYLIQDVATRNDKILNNDGSIKPQANVSGRTEPVSTTLQNVDSGGQITANGVDFTRPYLNKNTDNIADGTGTPLAGGKLGAIGFNTFSGAVRISGSTTQVPVSLNGAFTGSNPLSQSGVSTVILVATWRMQFGNILAGGPSGSVDPGSFGTWYVYVDMPFLNLSLSPLTYVATANVSDLTAGDGRICLGKITTAGGGGGAGAGTGGGGNTGIRALL